MSNFDNRFDLIGFKKIPAYKPIQLDLMVPKKCPVYDPLPLRLIEPPKIPVYKPIPVKPMKAPTFWEYEPPERSLSSWSIGPSAEPGAVARPGRLPADL